ncbi:anti-phage dCTP deaminase [Paraburkholderia terricola]|uniref:anti-phage dCTP deaminase n=1 Tax=Paraburkholderia terricola TaxID=169427 RepID=UPI000DEEF9F5|nr:anti-phage dCTP deaminase [Paraburkholderia terricola]AXE93950.1 deoxycytidylate deaminase [Paraburkholderia terricola]
MAAKEAGSSSRQKKRAAGDSATGEQKAPATDSTLTPRPQPELVFGLVGPVGVNLEPVISILTRELKTFSYSTKTVRLSKQIESFFSSDHSKEQEDKRIVSLMDEGTRLRTESGRGDAVALLGIAEIMRIRDEEFDGIFERHAYILRSLKHPHEVETLRNVYGKGFFLISVYSPREVRVNALSERISKSQFGKGNNARAKAEEIVERDELEENTHLGQDVKDAFPMADLFVDSRNKTALDGQISRFLQLLFGNIFLTPSRDEHGMYYARSAALRSADLGRQVGAAILRAEGDLIAVGCNDVPKFGGDLYWPGDKGDARDFQQGVDATAEERTQVIGELLERFSRHGLLSNDNTKIELSRLVHELVSGEMKQVLKGTRVMNLLEFGRSVHAEMAALMSAARLGISVQGATLFSTTFPCHMCARHIVASGIKRVVYIEPYPKSKAKQLHQDSISVDPATESNDHVNFEPFVGVSPKQYQEIFNARESRKNNDGKIIDWRTKYSKPRFMRFLNTYHDIEVAIVATEIPLLAEKLNISVS